MTYWLTGKGGRGLRGWSPYSCSECLDLVCSTLVDTAADGEALLSADLDIFETVAGKQPAFLAWRTKMYTQKVKTPNGAVSFNPLAFALKRARNPGEEEDKRTRPMTIKLIEAHPLSRRCGSSSEICSAMNQVISFGMCAQLFRQ